MSCDSSETEYFNPQKGKCVSACPFGQPYQLINKVKVCQEECRENCLCDGPMTNNSVSGFVVCTCDLDRGFVQASNECVCKFGMYYLIKNDEHKCVSADGCSDEEYLIYERDRTCISQEKCTALNKLVSLDGKFCKTLGD